MKTQLIAIALVSMVAMSLIHVAQAGVDWTDHCHPDAVALSQAVKDFPADRFDSSACADSIYRRGICEVLPSDPPSGRTDEETVFKVKLRNNSGEYRSYEILMALDSGADRHGTACGVRRLKRMQVRGAAQ